MPIGVNSFDLVIFRLVNGIGPSWLDAVFLLFSSVWAAAVCVTLVVIVLLTKYRPAAYRALVEMALALCISDAVGFHLLKPWLGRTRPCYLLPEGSAHVIARAANVGSMPSLHAANSFAVAFVLTMVERRFAIVAYPGAVLVAISRVYVGVHWPTDVLGGAIWGTFSGVSATAIVGRLIALRSRALRKTPSEATSHRQK